MPGTDRVLIVGLCSGALCASGSPQLVASVSGTCQPE